MLTKPLLILAVMRGGCYRLINKTSLFEPTGTGGGCYMGREEVVIWAERGLLQADKPKYRKAAPSKIEKKTKGTLFPSTFKV